MAAAQHDTGSRRDRAWRLAERKMKKPTVFLCAVSVTILAALGAAPAAEWRGDWEKALQGAKTEGKIVLAIPPSAELRKELEPLLKQKFGIDAELLVSRGADSANRIASEYNAGVRTIDGLIQGTTTAMSLQDGGMLDPVMAYMILPEVKDPKNWWGGHIWNDNLKTNRFLYSFVANAGTEGLFYNADLAKEEGLPASSGYGVLGIVKNPPHPNATKAFVNWFLGKDGQEFYAKVMKQGTRRLDVDTKWMSQIGVDAAKDVMTLADYHRLRNHLEDKVINVRRPAAKFAEIILK